MRAPESLIRYTASPTGSDENAKGCPSTQAQMTFAQALAQEMKSLGLSQVRVDKNGYCFGMIEANIPDWAGKTIGFIAHMDVVSEVPFTDIKPRIVKYDGGTVELESGDRLSPEEFPFLEKYKGETLIVTGGDTLLGADDKAGIADILTFAEYLKDHPDVKHGRIAIGFTPDEEIGRGADLFDIKAFGADYAYTVDGGAFGEVEYETFNAASARVTFTGVSIHPGSAKGKMINAVRLACAFDAMLPDERPENTEMYEGFYHLTSLEGGVEEAVSSYILRDHDWDKLTERKAAVAKAASVMNARYGRQYVNAEIPDSYRNMSEELKGHEHLIVNAREAVRKAGGTPVSLPVRGGTDGCRLSFMGLPCPNLGTGSHNHHGRREFAVAEEMDKCVMVLVDLAKAYA